MDMKAQGSQNGRRETYSLARVALVLRWIDLDLCVEDITVFAPLKSKCKDV